MTRTKKNPKGGNDIEEDAYPQYAAQAQESLDNLWQREIDAVENMTLPDFRNQILPLARIKKIMRLDEECKMISIEAPFVFAKAAELLVTELTLRAWLNTCQNKRRTLQKSDISAAVSRCDLFDFLIDIVPREKVLQQQPEAQQEPAPAPPPQQQQQQQQIQPMFVGGDMSQLVYQLRGGQNLTAPGAVMLPNSSTRNGTYTIPPQIFQITPPTGTPNQSTTNVPMLQFSNSNAVASAGTLSSKSTVPNTMFPSVMYNNSPRLPITLTPAQLSSLLSANPPATVVRNQPLVLNSGTAQFMGQTTPQRAIVSTIGQNLANTITIPTPNVTNS